MKKTILSIYLLLFVLCRASHALDLTPLVAHRTMNNISFDCPYFLDGKTRYAVNLPTETTVSGEKGVAHFSFTTLEGATFVMKTSPCKPETPFAGAELEAYQKLALSLAPAGSSEAVIEKETQDPLTINGWTSHGFTVSSHLPGTRLLQEIVFLNFSSSEQIILITTAGAQQFPRAVGKSSEIINSFRKLRPNEDLTAPVYP